MYKRRHCDSRCEVLEVLYLTMSSFTRLVAFATVVSLVQAHCTPILQRLMDKKKIDGLDQTPSFVLH
jgi:hypothetical protein